jgi:hypothetical protein
VLYEILIIDAIVCAILGGLIAQSKGRSGAEGAFVGALLGLLGLLLVVLSPSKAVMAPATVANASLRPCPKCAEMIQPAAVVCRFCGAQVEAATLTVAAVPTPAAADAVPTPAAAAQGGGHGLRTVLIVLVLVGLGAAAYMYLQQQANTIINSLPTSAR